MADWTSWASVPEAERTQLENFAYTFDQETGSQITISPDQLLAMANSGVTSQVGVGQWMHDHAGTAGNAVLVNMPWAIYGLDKDSYEQLATTYATTYEKVTGQPISAAELQQAFQTSNLMAGGMLSGSEFEQQLMNDAATQKQFQWVKYGLDYTQWQQQKLQMRTAYGRDVSDTEAATVLQYNRAASGSNMSAVARGSGQQQQQPSSGTGVSGSFAR